MTFLFIFQSKDDKRKQAGSFLIVSPSSVLYNWEDELNTWGYFKVAKFHGASKTETIEKAKRGKLEMVLTTYETFRNHIVSVFAYFSFEDYLFQRFSKFLIIAIEAVWSSVLGFRQARCFCIDPMGFEK